MATMASMVVSIMANVSQFDGAMNSTIRSINEVDRISKDAQKSVSGLGGEIINLVASLPAVRALAAAMEALGKAVHYVVTAIRDFLIMGLVIAWLKGVTLQAALASMVINKLAFAFITLFASITGPLFLAMVFTAESMNREILGIKNSLSALEDTLTPIQQMVQDIKTAWKEWSMLIGDGSLDMAAGLISAIMHFLADIARVIRHADELTGGWIVSGMKLAAVLLTIYGIYKLIRTVMVATNAIWLGTSIIKGLAMATVWLLKILGIQISIGVATAFWVSLTVVGLAAVAVAAGVATSYYSSMDTSINDVTISSKQLNNTISETISLYKELATSAKQMNDSARTPTQVYDSEIAKIKQVSTARGEVAEQLERYYSEMRRMINDINVGNTKNPAGVKMQLEDLQKKIIELQTLYNSSEGLSDSARLAAEEKARQKLFSDLKISVNSTQNAQQIYDETMKNINSVAHLMTNEEYLNAITNARKAFDKADEATLARAKAEKELADRLNAQEKNFRQMIQSPYEKYTEQLAKFNEVAERFSELERIRVQEKLLKDLLGDPQKQVSQNTDNRAMQAGTSEAYKRVQDTIRANRDPQIEISKRQLGVEEDQKKLLEEQLQETIRMREELEKDNKVELV